MSTSVELFVKYLHLISLKVWFAASGQTIAEGFVLNVFHSILGFSVWQISVKKYLRAWALLQIFDCQRLEVYFVSNCFSFPLEFSFCGCVHTAWGNKCGDRLHFRTLHKEQCFCFKFLYFVAVQRCSVLNYVKKQSDAVRSEMGLLAPLKSLLKSSFVSIPEFRLQYHTSNFVWIVAWSARGFDKVMVGQERCWHDSGKYRILNLGEEAMTGVAYFFFFFSVECGDVCFEELFLVKGNNSKSHTLVIMGSLIALRSKISCPAAFKKNQDT